jgi:hypothetical protein
MEIDKFMTAVEFAEKVNTAYPTVAKWLRDGRVPGAIRQKIGNLEIWMIPVDVLKDFVRPKMGRPTKQKDIEVATEIQSPPIKVGKKAKASKKGRQRRKEVLNESPSRQPKGERKRDPK